MKPDIPARWISGTTIEDIYALLDQESQIDLESPMMDPAVVMVQGARKPDQVHVVVYQYSIINVMVLLGISRSGGKTLA